MKKKYKIILTFLVPYIYTLTVTPTNWTEFEDIISTIIGGLGGLIPILIISFVLASLTFLNKTQRGKKFWDLALIISIVLTLLLFIMDSYNV